MSIIYVRYTCIYPSINIFPLFVFNKNLDFQNSMCFKSHKITCKVLKI